MGKVMKQLLQDKVDAVIRDYDSKRIDAKAARARLYRLGLNEHDIDVTMQYTLFNRTETVSGS